MGQNFQNIIYISAGIGIGVGIILNGELYKGESGYSGEMGHMIIDLNGKAVQLWEQRLLGALRV